MAKIVYELKNNNLLIERHKHQLEKEGIHEKVEIDLIITNAFLNSKISDIDYLLDELDVKIINETVIDKKGE